MYDKVKVSRMDGEVVECYDVRPRLFNTWLVDELGMAKTRMKSVGEAVDNLHRALSKLDSGVRDRITTKTVGELVNKFGEREEMYNSFKEEK
jgi:hypothetical protein